MSTATKAHFHLGEDELRRYWPFSLKATNIEGVYSLPPLPAGFDPNDASATELVKSGVLWRKPTAIDNPHLMGAWQRMYAKERIDQRFHLPHLEPQLGRTHILKERPRRVSDTSYTSANWAGAVFSSGGPWQMAVGIWSIPTVTKPSEPAGADLGWDSSSWVGIDGFNIAGSLVSNDVLQAGVNQSVNSSGVASYNAWFEWYAPPQADSPSYIYQTDFSGFPVSAGQNVLCIVVYVPIILGSAIIWLGYIVFSNLTTNRTSAILLAPPPGATAAANTVEWIMEEPGINNAPTILPKFTPVTFTSAGAGSYSKAVGNPQFADTVNIVNSGKTLTSVTTGSDTVTIDFIG